MLIIMSYGWVKGLGKILVEKNEISNLPEASSSMS